MGSVYPSILEGSSSIHGAREGKIRHDQPRVHGQTGRAAPCRILVDRTDQPHHPTPPTTPPHTTPPHPHHPHTPPHTHHTHHYPHNRPPHPTSHSNTHQRSI